MAMGETAEGARPHRDQQFEILAAGWRKVLYRAEARQFPTPQRSLNQLTTILRRVSRFGVCALRARGAT
jgi:hypothetical protein